MDKLKYIKLENEDGSYSESIPLSVDSNYVDVNGTSLINVLANTATKNEIEAIASGSPAGVYQTTTELIEADPDHSKIYVIATDGKWYYYNTGTDSWVAGGIYQSSLNVDEVSRLQNQIDEVVSGLNFEKISNNLLNPDDKFMNNALFDEHGHVNNDNRGFRIYCLNTGIGKNISIKIDKQFFFKIEASGNTLSQANNIVGVDNTTYVNSFNLTPRTELSFVTSKQYVFLAFFPATPQPTLASTTTQIMVTNTITPQNYVPYGDEAKIDVVNEQYSNDYSIFNQAYIKNQALVGVQRKDGGNNNGDYTGIKMESNITKVRAKIKFNKGAYITLISTPNGSSHVRDITNKSIHINIGKTNYYIGYFNNQNLTNTKTGTFSGLNDNTEYIIGYDINNATNELTVYLPNGETYTEINDAYTQANGQFVIFEHFIDTSVQDFSSAYMLEIFAQDTQGNKLYDDFARWDGAIGTSPNGYVYKQFSNNNPQNWEIS